MDIFTSTAIYLDTRRVKNNGKFPVKLRVFLSFPKKQKYYSTPFNLTQDEFDFIWVKTPSRPDLKEIRLKLDELEAHAKEIIESMAFFTFEIFERRLFMKPGNNAEVKRQYEMVIETMYNNHQYSSANNYEFCLKSLDAYLQHARKGSIDRLQFQDITPGFLKEFEKFMVHERGRSYTTVGIYLRTLRAVFNIVIKEGYVKRAYYPFGTKRDGKYEIPYSQKVKKALTNEQLKTLFDSKPKTPEQEKAKDFWFFSYSCSGMNMKDILQLKRKDFNNESIKFFRAKTINTTRNKKEITVYLNEFSLSIIKKYSLPNLKPNDYLFPIFTIGMTPLEQDMTKRAFIRFVNQHMALLCKQNDMDPVSTYWARHSYATNSIRKGASMEFIQESLGHLNLATTQNYFAGFEDEARRSFVHSLMDFS